MAYLFNKYQSSLEELQIDSYPEEIKEQFYNFINNVPFIKYMISADRPHACDLERDKDGKIIFDVCRPPILDDMDYFRPAAIHYNKYGCYTKLRPNFNPNSEYGKWIREETRRCHYGMVRPSDGMWIDGDMYFFLNYWPILQTKIVGNSKKGERITDFPEVWEGINMRYQYINQAMYGGKYDSNGGNNGCEISSRGKSKSYTMSAMMGKRYTLGESPKVCKSVKCMATAYQKQYLTSDGILNKFVQGKDFLKQNTQFPNKELKSSMQEMAWRRGYIDLDTNTQKGTLNEVIGVSAKDDISKVRGKRQNLIVVEEFGSFPNVLNLYNIMLPSVQEGDISFGTMYLIGTAGDDESDFQGASEIVYNPKGYRMYALPNVFDLEGQGRSLITFFFPGYLNRKGCYDKDGNSNITKALLEILVDRYRVKYNSTDVNSITKVIAETPITPQEAILRTKGNLFPVTQLNERLNQIDEDTELRESSYVGNLVLGRDGNVEFKPSTETPIYDFPLKDNKAKGAIEIFEMPQKDSNGKIPSQRYILGHDPVDDDVANTMSLTSTFVLDLFTDRIVAEYTGRQDYANDNFEIVRRLCLFYNGKCLYEQNKKGIFAYFSQMNCTHLLADTPEYLKDKQIIKEIGWGNKSKGVSATAGVNNYANGLIRDWLLKPVQIQTLEDREEVVKTVPNLSLLKNRALIKELILFNPDINVDRIRALGMVMLYREEKMILYQGDMNKTNQETSANYLGNDKFDFETCKNSKTNFYATVTNLNTGLAEYERVNDLENKMDTWSLFDFSVKRRIS